MIKVIPPNANVFNTDETKEVGFVARALVSASLPHSRPKGIIYKRQCNNFTLSIIGDEAAGGIPYGSYPRLILSWLSTEVVKTQSREIILGKSLSSFMKSLGLSVTGGKSGTMSRFKEQLCRLFAATITCTYSDKENGKFVSTKISIADKTKIFWNVTRPEQLDIFNSKIILGEEFFNEIIENPIPVDIESIEILKDSSLALDIYFWLTYRMSYLKKPLVISYDSLQSQFGAGYTDTRHSKYEFKRKFLIQLKKVLNIYQEANVTEIDEGLLLSPSYPHIKTFKIEDAYQNDSILKIIEILRLKFTLSEKQIENILNEYSLESIEEAVNNLQERLEGESNIKINNLSAYFISVLKSKFKSNFISSEDNNLEEFIASIDNSQEKEVLLELLKIYGSAIFKSWFTKIRLSDITLNQITYSCNNNFIAMHIQNKYGSDFLNLWQKINPYLSSCIFISKS